MENHLTRLAAASIVLGALHLLAGGFLAFAVGGATFRFGVTEEESFAQAMTSLISLMLLFTGTLALLAGFWIRQRIPRGRVVGLTSSFFLLLIVPLGTLLGSYGIWVLFQDDIEAHFRRR